MARFDRVARTADRRGERCTRIVGSVETHQHLCPRSVPEVVPLEPDDRVEVGETRGGALRHPHRHCTIECDDGCRRNAFEYAVEADDRFPIGVVRGLRTRMYSGDQGLDAIRTDPR